MGKKIEIAAFHKFPVGGKEDKKCQKIFKDHGGNLLNHGCFLATGDVDMGYDVPAGKAEACRVALRAAGFRLDMNDA